MSHYIPTTCVQELMKPQTPSHRVYTVPTKPKLSTKMCQMQTSFYSCAQLAEGNNILCKFFQQSMGRHCSGYSSFSRVLDNACPNCQAGKRHPKSQHLRATTNTARGSKSVKSGHKEAAAQKNVSLGGGLSDVEEVDSSHDRVRKK